ncbi:conserved hypothetical protein, secreted [marine sediment metagenome]|uniref:PepSY domain-containing protein n=1 Tax=marine sediment metagenome TaxID=412755 RepID=A0A1B6NTR5_9ZZZZ
MAFRKYHRWLGFFLAGIMGVYALSGILLIFRPTDILKYEQTHTKQLEANLTKEELLPLLKMRGSKVTSENADEIVLNVGSYDKATVKRLLRRKTTQSFCLKMVKASQSDE